MLTDAVERDLATVSRWYVSALTGRYSTHLSQVSEVARFLEPSQPRLVSEISCDGQGTLFPPPLLIVLLRLVDAESLVGPLLSAPSVWAPIMHIPTSRDVNTSHRLLLLSHSDSTGSNARTVLLFALGGGC